MSVKKRALSLILVFLASNMVMGDLRYPGEQLSFCLKIQDKIEQEEILYKNLATNRSFQVRKPTRAEKSFMETFMSFKDFMEQSLHNPDWGYYGAGNVEFKTEHFLTVPKQVSPAFGAMIAYQAYAMWRSMLLSGDMTDGEVFHILEFGAGDGDLAYDILDSINRNVGLEKRSNTQTHWQKFYQQVRYCIGERAPALCIRQKARNKKFIDQKKCEVINTDAREMKKHFDHKVKGLVLSNELLDTFCLHKVHAMKDQPWKVCYLVPVLKKSFFEQNTNQVLQRFKKVFEERDQFNRENNAVLLKNMLPNAEELLLTRQDYFYLKAHEKMQSQSFSSFLRLEEVYVIDLDLIEELSSYVKTHGNYLKHLIDVRDNSRMRYFYLNHSAPQFIREAASVLDGGFVMTIDYGDTSSMHDWQLNCPSTAIRMYPERTSCYQEPGSADITSDVNFTDLYFVGKEAGFDVSFYGCQKAMQGNFTAIDEETLLAPFDMKNDLFSPVLPDGAIEYFCTSQSSNMFKMLIQKKVNSRNGYQLMVQSDSLFPAW